MNSQHDNDLFSHPFLENGVFWIALILLSMGVITTFYYQDTASLKTVSPHIYRYNPPEAEASSPSTTRRQENPGPSSLWTTPGSGNSCTYSTYSAEGGTGCIHDRAPFRLWLPPAR